MRKDEELLGCAHLTHNWCLTIDADTGFAIIGLRHVPEEEDQMRREDAQMLALHQLQDGMRFYTR